MGKTKPMTLQVTDEFVVVKKFEPMNPGDRLEDKTQTRKCSITFPSDRPKVFQRRQRDSTLLTL